MYTPPYLIIHYLSARSIWPTCIIIDSQSSYRSLSRYWFILITFLWYLCVIAIFFVFKRHGAFVLILVCSTHSIMCYCWSSTVPNSALYVLTYSIEQSTWEANRVWSSQEIPHFNGTRRFITAFTRACHLSLSCASSTQSIPPTSYLLKIHLNIILPSTPG